LVKLTEGSSIITYAYDALTRRTTKTNSSETRHYYYDRQWRAVEERVAGASVTVDRQYTWSPIDRWTLIRRKRTTGGTSLNETRFVLKDYLDPTAIIDSSAAVDERFGYDAFGQLNLMTPAFATRSTSVCDWNFLFHAEFLDSDSGLYNYGYRYYHPELGRWISRDPIGEEGGLNLYGFLGNRPGQSHDVLGLDDGCTGEISFGHWRSSSKTGINTDYERRKAEQEDNDPSLNPPLTCFVGCGANKLNQGANESGFGIKDYPRNNSPTDGVWPSERSKRAPNGPIPGLENNDYNLHADPEDVALLNEDLEAAAEALAKEICLRNCCGRYMVRLHCVEPNTHTKCGQIIKEGSCE
jgi:RHS repeat-associated protein